MSAVTTIATAGERLAVVVAHPDDETFRCGSLIAAAVAAGAHVTVICATRGESGERRPDPLTDSWPLGLLREAELCQAAIVLGVEEVVLLDYVDSGSSGPTPDRGLVAAPLDQIVPELVAQLTAISPDVVLAVDGSDGHRDHRHLRDALTLAMAQVGPRVRLVHTCLARGLMREWAASMRTANVDREHLTIDENELGRPDDELLTIDTSAVLSTRERAIACHLSQSSPFEGLPADLRRRFLTTDHIVEITDRRPSTGVAESERPYAAT